MTPTGFCWACGRACAAAVLFCGDKCQRRHDRERAAEERRQVRKGKRQGYGAAGSTH